MMRAMKKLKWVLVAALVVLALFVVKALAEAGAFRTVVSQGGEGCRPLEGVVGAEDVEFDARAGVVLLSSQDRRAWLAGQPSPGALFVWDPTGDAPPRPLAMDFRGEFHPHGLSLFERQVFVVNHPTELTSVVEVFTLEGDATETLMLRHERTISAPEFISLNDLVAVGRDTFYVTNDAGTVNHTAARVAETVLKLPWASVVFFDGTKARVVAEGFSYANGVTTSRDRRTVFVSESTGRHLVAFARDSVSGALTELGRTQLESGLDNLTLAPDDSVWIGAHPRLLAFLGHAKDAAKKSPSQVLRATWDAAQKRFVVEVVLTDDGTKLSGSSVAVPLSAGRVLVGSVFEPHLLDCRLTR